MEALATGRRDRNMREKQDRIFAAAREHFARDGFARVTTQAVSDSADVAAGTLFRYASSKSDLLLMVYNEEFRLALSAGAEGAASADSPTSAITALLLAPIERAQLSPENSVVYQRELLFGSSREHYRSEGLRLMAEFERALGEILEQAAADRGLTATDRDVRVASSSLFGTMHLAIARQSTHLHPTTEVRDDIVVQARQIVSGFLATLTPSQDRSAQPAPTTPKELK